MKKTCLIVFILLLFSHQIVFASSSYILPYPGVMPGNKFYILSDFFDQIKSIFVFGDFASFKYNLSQSDKYLVEAKTLFEYGQYPLAVKSLKQSDLYYNKTYESLQNARSSHKDISNVVKIFNNATQKHNEIIVDLQKDLPSVFVWEYEKKPSETVSIENSLNASHVLRLSNE